VMHLVGALGLFQSTRPRGARLLWGAPPHRGAAVSIHAPTRGATSVNHDLHDLHEFQSTRPRGARLGHHSDRPDGTQFQSTRPRGARLETSYSAAGANRFQSTRPRGARPDGITRYHPHSGFNPRAHAGRDTYEVLSFRNNLVSIHAPTRGATIHVLPYLGLFRFQSTRPRGARRLIRASLMGFSGFNPRAHAGRDSAPCVRKTN